MKCEVCKGTGKVFVTVSDEIENGYEECPCCDGTGEIVNEDDIIECSHCLDRGFSYGYALDEEGERAVVVHKCPYCDNIATDEEAFDKGSNFMLLLGMNAVHMSDRYKECPVCGVVSNKDKCVSCEAKKKRHSLI